jgi:Copper amine oxidase N-terminal domain.
MPYLTLSDRTRKLLLSLAVIVAFPAASTLPHDIASAAVSEYSIVSQPFSINGTSSHIGTINKNGSTYIALQNIDAALGLTTRYDPSSRLVQVTGHNRSLRIGLSTGAMSLNGQPISGPDPVFQNGTTYLPLRFLAERFGYEVTYDKRSQQIGLQSLSEI